MDLFDAQGVDSYGPSDPPASGPLAVRMRPTTVEELLGQAHLLTPGSPLARLLDSQSTSVPSVILWGPPGTGKTTLAYLIARQSGRRFAEVSAVNAGVKEVREVIASAKHALMASGEETVLFIDEVHRFSGCPSACRGESVDHTRCGDNRESQFFSNFTFAVQVSTPCTSLAG